MFYGDDIGQKIVLWSLHSKQLAALSTLKLGESNII